MSDKAVSIAGAGLAGLCTAVLLKKNKVPFTVFEKDREPNARDQGYRIHLDWKTVEILKEILHPDTFDVFKAISEPLGGRFTFWSADRKLLAAIKTLGNNKQESGRAISRYSLRQILLPEVAENVQYAKELVRFEVEENKVTVFFEDGSSDTGAFLVGADGTSSKVTREFKPEYKAQNTGSIYVIGKLPLSEKHHDLFPKPPFERLGIVLGKGGINMFMSEQLITQNNESHPELFPYLNDPKDFSIWSLFCKKEVFSNHDNETDIPKQEIKELCLKAFKNFHPDFVQMVNDTDAETLVCLPVSSTKKTTTWKTNARVTLLGDAVHAMTPLQGKGANKAIQDAYHLGRLLAHTDVNTHQFCKQLAFFEKKMQKGSRSAVKRSSLLLNLAISTGIKKWIFLNSLQVFGKLNSLFQSKKGYLIIASWL